MQPQPSRIDQPDSALDHLVVAGPDLAALVAEFERLTGIRPSPGGRHVGLGTANYLVGLGGRGYLELIGPDPDAEAPEDSRLFGIDDLTGSRLVTWAVHPADLDGCVAAARAAGYDAGEVREMSRRTADGELLRWRLSVRDNPDGLVPFLIDWGSTPHPTTRGLPQVPLLSLSATHPEPERVRSALAALGVTLPVRLGNRPMITAVVEGAHGPVVLT